MSDYYEVDKQYLEALEAQYGLPDSVVTRSWTTVTTSLNGIWVIIEATEPLDESIIHSPKLTRLEAHVLAKTARYQEPMFI